MKKLITLLLLLLTSVGVMAQIEFSLKDYDTYFFRGAVVQKVPEGIIAFGTITTKERRSERKHQTGMILIRSVDDEAKLLDGDPIVCTISYNGLFDFNGKTIRNFRYMLKLPENASID